jgi:hypothetical protein
VHRPFAALMFCIIAVTSRGVTPIGEAAAAQTIMPGVATRIAAIPAHNRVSTTGIDAL